MSFGNSLARIRDGGSPSHMWIHFHWLVEAYCRTSGRSFREVFAELELRFGFSRRVRSRWPGVETMRAAAEWLHTLRDAHLAERRDWIAGQRRAKAASDRHSAPAGLREAEARSRAHAASLPALGCWGWRRRREGGG
jgi:hypothetical protein